MKGKLSDRHQNRFLYQAVNMFNSAVKMGILEWGLLESCSVLEQTPSGQSKNGRFFHFLIGFMTQPRRLPLDENSKIFKSLFNPSISPSPAETFFIIVERKKNLIKNGHFLTA